MIVGFDLPVASGIDHSPLARGDLGYAALLLDLLLFVVVTLGRVLVILTVPLRVVAGVSIFSTGTSPSLQCIRQMPISGVPGLV